MELYQKMKIDSHQHFWNYSPEEYGWIRGRNEVLQKNHLPGDLAPLLKSIGFDGTITVEARQKLEESRWLLELADGNDWIKGVVGWVDLRSENIREQLETYGPHPKFVGIRHVIHDEPDDEFCLQADFQRGVALLHEFDLTYDLLIFNRHLPPAMKLVKKFPDQPFVVDHIAKPAIRDREISPWKERMKAIAAFPNVYCKLSGLVTETALKQWKPADFHPYLDIVLEAFGEDRVMIGSDWPVCKMSGEYQPVMQIVLDYAQKFSAATRDKILGKNCAKFYGIKPAIP